MRPHCTRCRCLTRSTRPCASCLHCNPTQTLCASPHVRCDSLGHSLRTISRRWGATGSTLSLFKIALTFIQIVGLIPRVYEVRQPPNQPKADHLHILPSFLPVPLCALVVVCKLHAAQSSAHHRLTSPHTSLPCRTLFPSCALVVACCSRRRASALAQVDLPPRYAHVWKMFERMAEMNDFSLIPCMV